MQVINGLKAAQKFKKSFWVSLIKLWYHIAFNGGEKVDSYLDSAAENTCHATRRMSQWLRIRVRVDLVGSGKT